MSHKTIWTTPLPLTPAARRRFARPAAAQFATFTVPRSLI
jgi:hypothetical protein